MKKRRRRKGKDLQHLTCCAIGGEAQHLRSTRAGSGSGSLKRARGRRRRRRRCPCGRTEEHIPASFHCSTEMHGAVTKDWVRCLVGGSDSWWGSGGGDGCGCGLRVWAAPGWLACCFGGAGEGRWGNGGSKLLNAHPCSGQENKIIACLPHYGRLIQHK